MGPLEAGAPVCLAPSVSAPSPAAQLRKDDLTSYSAGQGRPNRSCLGLGRLVTADLLGAAAGHPKSKSDQSRKAHDGPMDTPAMWCRRNMMSHGMSWGDVVGGASRALSDAAPDLADCRSIPARSRSRRHCIIVQDWVRMVDTPHLVCLVSVGAS